MKPGSGLARRMELGFILSVLCTTVVSAAPPAPQGEAMYAAIDSAAASGSARARELKSAVDAYLARHKLSAAQLGAPPARSVRTEALGAVRLRVDGSAPWVVRVTNDTDLGTVAALDTYRRARHGSLAALAAANPARIIRAAIAPSNFVDLPGFARGLACDCRGVSIVVDVFSSTGWLMASGRALSGEDIAVSARSLEADLLAQAGGSLDQFAKSDRRGVHLTVRRIEVEVPAGQALALAGRDGVLLVDAVTDIADAYRDTAALVEVGPGPDAFCAYAALNLGNLLTPGPKPGKGSAK